MKLITIQKNNDKMIGGLRLNIELYDKLMVFAKLHNCSVQEIIRFILNVEIDNYK